jgi:hypothetical protein
MRPPPPAAASAIAVQRSNARAASGVPHLHVRQTRVSRDGRRRLCVNACHSAVQIVQEAGGVVRPLTIKRVARFPQRGSVVHPLCAALCNASVASHSATVRTRIAALCMQ